MATKNDLITAVNGWGVCGFVSVLQALKEHTIELPPKNPYEATFKSLQEFLKGIDEKLLTDKKLQAAFTASRFTPHYLTDEIPLDQYNKQIGLIVLEFVNTFLKQPRVFVESMDIIDFTKSFYKGVPVPQNLVNGLNKDVGPTGLYGIHMTNKAATFYNATPNKNSPFENSNYGGIGLTHRILEKLLDEVGLVCEIKHQDITSPTYTEEDPIASLKGCILGLVALNEHNVKPYFGLRHWVYCDQNGNISNYGKTSKIDQCLIRTIEAPYIFQDSSNPMAVLQVRFVYKITEIKQIVHQTLSDKNIEPKVV
ncbi:MAG: hypothetical protein V4616_11545 [Bacteroidota bacterium]